jgi:hypothetical protein
VFGRCSLMRKFSELRPVKVTSQNGEAVNGVLSHEARTGKFDISPKQPPIGVHDASKMRALNRVLLSIAYLEES